MHIYLPTGQTFENRKEAKNYFGVARYRKHLKDKSLIITNYIAYDELQKNNQPDSIIEP